MCVFCRHPTLHFFSMYCSSYMMNVQLTMSTFALTDNKALKDYVKLHQKFLLALSYYLQVDKKQESKMLDSKHHVCML